MNTIYDLGMAIEQIRSAANEIEVSGAKNIDALHMIFQTCNDIITALNEIVENYNPENSIGQDGDEDGQIDS